MSRGALFLAGWRDEVVILMYWWLQEAKNLSWILSKYRKSTSGSGTFKIVAATATFSL